jgi:hypothetical protein
VGSFGLDSCLLEYGPMLGPCENGNEYLGSVNDGEFFISVNVSFARTLFYGFS